LQILKNHVIEYNWPDELQSPFFEAVSFLKEFNLIDSEYFINDELKKNSTILAEGAQGSRFLILILEAIRSSQALIR
jgi:adenylosuccinate synthase